MIARVLPVLLAAAACSAPRSASPGPSNRDPPPAAGRTDRAIALLRQLADDLAHDRPIGALVDAKDGAWLWYQPGAAVTPSVHVDPGDHRTPSELLAGWNPGMREAWAQDVAKEIDHGLTVMDLDPDPDQPKYWVDCGAEGMPPPARGFLQTRGVDLSHESGKADTPVEHATTPLGLHFVYGSAAVYLSERDGQLAIAHVLGWTPCEA